MNLTCKLWPFKRITLQYYTRIINILLARIELHARQCRPENDDNNSMLQLFAKTNTPPEGTRPFCTKKKKHLKHEKPKKKCLMKGTTIMMFHWSDWSIHYTCRHVVFTVFSRWDLIVWLLRYVNTRNEHYTHIMQ